MARAFIGTAAWNIPKELAEKFPPEGTHLERYAQVFSGVEINSSFYREHKAPTYKKWAASVPKDFLFSVKLSKQLTHIQKLAVEVDAVKAVLGGISELGDKWGALLVQLPPKLAFDEAAAEKFFAILRNEYSGLIALEPRHLTWVSAEALKLQRHFNLTKVFADPEPTPLPDYKFSNTSESVYLRLHGTPVIYKSTYESERLQFYHQNLQTKYAKAIQQRQAWCIFDNTTFGFATANALELQGLPQPRLGLLRSAEL